VSFDPDPEPEYTMSDQPPRAANQARFIARVVVPVALLAGTAAILGVSAMESFGRAPSVRVTPVAVIASRTAAQPAGGGIQAAGWMEPAPFAVEVRALREGVVLEVLALEGARVEKGQLLATLDSAEQELAVEQANAELRIAEADELAREAVASAAEEILARAIEPTRRLRVAESALEESIALVAQLKAQIEEARFAAREARDEFERRSALAEAGAFSTGEARRLGLRADALDAKARALEEERHARAARRTAAEAELAAAREAHATLVAERGARDEAMAELAHAEAERELAVAAVDSAKLALARSEIRAPRAGVVLTRAAVPGARAGGEEGALFTLYDPSQLQVRCDVPLKDAARLAVGLVAEVRSDALPDARFKGTVVRIVPLGDLEKNTVQCKVLIENPDPALRPDMLVRVRIATSPGEATRAAEAVAVPRDALRAASADEREAEVLVAVPDGALARTELRRVALGAPRDGGWVEVIDGLAAGDRVVLDVAIEEGARIAPIESLKGDAP
jgi:RND family efflux transporter MFP subunit